MSIRKTLSIVMVFMMLLSCGCQSTPLEETTEELVEAPAMGNVEITDPDELEALWSNYLFLGISTVFNTEEYSSVADIDANRRLIYCWKQYVRDMGEEAAKEYLEPVSEESRSLYFAMETAQDYMELYFNTREIDLDTICEPYYDAEKGAFTLSPHNREIPSYQDINPWGITLEKVVHNEDGSITVEMVHYVSREQELVERIYLSNFGMREDGTYYFMSGGWEFLDNDLVTLIGDFQELGPMDERFT